MTVATIPMLPLAHTNTDPLVLVFIIPPLLWIVSLLVRLTLYLTRDTPKPRPPARPPIQGHGFEVITMEPQQGDPERGSPSGPHAEERPWPKPR